MRTQCGRIAAPDAPSIHSAFTIGASRQSLDAERSLGLVTAGIDLLIARRPGDDEAVGWNTAVQHTVGDAVHVLDVLRETGAEAIEVQVCVASDERIVRPVDAPRRPSSRTTWR